MMICPETFYDEYLKGKNTSQIMTVIRGLKQKLGRLKNIVEHPEYECTMNPSERVRISCYHEYLERAKKALTEAGGNYIPSAAEKKSMELEENIPFVTKVEFCIGGYLTGYETKIYTVKGNKIYVHVENNLDPESSDSGEAEVEGMDKGCFLKTLKDLHVGEWRKHYNTDRFGYMVLDGTQWHLKIYFSNEYKTVKIYGDNAYPYNFDRVLELFEIDE